MTTSPPSASSPSLRSSSSPHHDVKCLSWLFSSLPRLLRHKLRRVRPYILAILYYRCRQNSSLLVSRVSTFPPYDHDDFRENGTQTNNFYGHLTHYSV